MIQRAGRIELEVGSVNLAIEADRPARLDHADNRETGRADRGRLSLEETDGFSLFRPPTFPFRISNPRLTQDHSPEIPAGSAVVGGTRKRHWGLDGQLEVVRTEGGKLYLHGCEISSARAPPRLGSEFPK